MTQRHRFSPVLKHVRILAPEQEVEAYPALGRDHNLQRAQRRTGPHHRPCHAVLALGLHAKRTTPTRQMLLGQALLAVQPLNLRWARLPVGADRHQQACPQVHPTLLLADRHRQSRLQGRTSRLADVPARLGAVQAEGDSLVRKDVDRGRQMHQGQKLRLAAPDQSRCLSPRRRPLRHSQCRESCCKRSKIRWRS